MIVRKCGKVSSHLMHVEQHVVGVPVVPLGLLLPRDDDGCLGRLFILPLGHVQPECVKN